MKSSAAEILHDYGPFPVSTTCMGSRMTVSVWFASGDKLNAFDPANGKMLRSIDVAAHANGLRR